MSHTFRSFHTFPIATNRLVIIRHSYVKWQMWLHRTQGVEAYAARVLFHIPALQITAYTYATRLIIIFRNSIVTGASEVMAITIRSNKTITTMSYVEYYGSPGRRSHGAAKANKVKITAYFVDALLFRQHHAERENWIECAVQLLHFPYFRLISFDYLLRLSVREISVLRVMDTESDLYSCRVSWTRRRKWVKKRSKTRHHEKEVM